MNRRYEILLQGLVPSSGPFKKLTLPKSRSLAALEMTWEEEEFRSQNSEVRMHVRGSRGRHGLLTARKKQIPRGARDDAGAAVSFE
jgi:hypothetical protein